MNIEDIRKLDDKTPIDSVRGVVEKQYAPADQTANDLQYSQHRQSFLIHDENGNKLMVTLMKSALHILDSIEGHELQITAGRDDKGALRGILLNKWKPANSQFENIAVKVYPEATIRAIAPSGGNQQTAAAPATTSAPAAALASDQVTPFEKHLTLAAYGYCLCLDMAEKVINDRPELQKDPQNQRAIATNFWMECKHHLQTLAPGLNGNKSVAKGTSTQAPAAGGKQAPSTLEPRQNDDDITIISRIIAGYAIFSELKDNAKAKLTELAVIADERNLWERIYDTMLNNLAAEIDGEIDDILVAANKVYDAAKEKLSAKSKTLSVEKFFATAPSVWKQTVVETLNQAS